MNPLRECPCGSSKEHKNATISGFPRHPYPTASARHMIQCPRGVFIWVPKPKTCSYPSRSIFANLPITRNTQPKTNPQRTRRMGAGQRGMEIVRTYADEERSGLTFERRDALKRLIGDVESGATDFAAILVCHDVSRWGRFQDLDESGYYEYICKRAGVKVHYCAEQFDNDGSPFAAIVKSIKRAMAGEYSRELSVNSFVGQSRLSPTWLSRRGFRGIWNAAAADRPIWQAKMYSDAWGI